MTAKSVTTPCKQAFLKRPLRLRIIRGNGTGGNGTGGGGTGGSVLARHDLGRHDLGTHGIRHGGTHPARDMPFKRAVRSQALREFPRIENMGPPPASATQPRLAHTPAGNTSPPSAQ